MNPLIITAYALRHLATCPRRIWLDRHADPFQRVDVPSPLAAQGIRHEDAVSDRRYGPTTPVRSTSWPDAVKLTQTLMKGGARAIRGASLERIVTLNSEITVRGRMDWLQRLHHAPHLYFPVEIKLRQTPTLADELQLDLYLWLLEGAQGAGITEGVFLLGEDARQVHQYNAERLLDALRQTADILAAADAPSIFLASHCDLCPWKAACVQTAHDMRDVAALPGLKRDTWQALRDSRLNTWDDLIAQTPKELQRFRGLGPATARTLHAYAQAFAHSAPRWLDVLSPEASQPGLMFDLETRLDNGQPWCFGWLEPGGTFRAAVVNAYCDSGPLSLSNGATITIVPDSDTGWRMFADAAEHYPGPIYHWSGFERSVLRATAPGVVTDALFERLHDLHRTFRQTCVLPVRGTSIKVVAGYLGLTWPDSSSALTAWSDYLAWLQEGDDDRLACAIAYNRADVEALDLIQRWLIAHTIR